MKDKVLIALTVVNVLVAGSNVLLWKDYKHRFSQVDEIQRGLNVFVPELRMRGNDVEALKHNTKILVDAVTNLWNAAHRHQDGTNAAVEQKIESKP